MGFSKKPNDDYDSQVAKCAEEQEKFEMLKKSMEELSDEITKLRADVADSRSEYHLAMRELESYKSRVEAAEKKKDEWLQLQSKLSGMMERWQGLHVSFIQSHISLSTEEENRRALKKQLKKDFKLSLKSKMSRSRMND